MISEWSTSTILKGAFGLYISPTQRRMVGDFTKRQPRRSRRTRRRKGGLLSLGPIGAGRGGLARWRDPGAGCLLEKGEPDIASNERARRRTGSRPSRFILASFTECTQGRSPG